MFDFRISHGLFYLQNKYKTPKCNNNAVDDSHVDKFFAENLRMDDHTGIQWITQ